VGGWGGQIVVVGKNGHARGGWCKRPPTLIDSALTQIVLRSSCSSSSSISASSSSSSSTSASSSSLAPLPPAARSYFSVLLLLLLLRSSIFFPPQFQFSQAKTEERTNERRQTELTHSHISPPQLRFKLSYTSITFHAHVM
jgi:hypothetical protein